jgi:HSP20 family protein
MLALRTTPFPLSTEPILFPVPSRVLSRFFDDEDENLFMNTDSTFSDPFFHDLARTKRRRLTMDLIDNDKSYSFTTDLPGVKKGDLTIEIKDDKVLTISAERKESKQSPRKADGRGGAVQQYSSTYQRSIVLPDDAEVDPEKISAQLSDGVLTIDIPKTAKSSKSSKIVNIK